MAAIRAGLVCVSCVATLAAMPARAQTDVETGITGPVVWNIGGSIAVPVGPASDRINTGGGLAVGVTFNANRLLGAQFEYGVDWAGLKTGALNAASISGSTYIQYFNLNGVIHPMGNSRVSFYLVGGGGLYYRSVQVTRVDGVALAPYCDPYLFYCSAVPVTTGTVLGTRSRWDWGVDAGVGITFLIAPPLRAYVEARYHYIFGPSFTDASGSKRTADGQLVPVTFGVRF